MDRRAAIVDENENGGPKPADLFLIFFR